MNTIQQKNGWLFVVKQTGPAQFEWWRTIYRAISFEAAFGNHVGEEVIESGVVYRWQSLDGGRKYQLASDEPDFIEGVKVEIATQPIPNKEIESVTLRKAMDRLASDVTGEAMDKEEQAILNPNVTKPARVVSKPGQTRRGKK